MRFMVIQIPRSTFNLLSSVLNTTETLAMIVKFHLPKRLNLFKFNFTTIQLCFALKYHVTVLDDSPRQLFCQIRLQVRSYTAVVGSCHKSRDQHQSPSAEQSLLSTPDIHVSLDTPCSGYCWRSRTDILNTIRRTVRESSLFLLEQVL